MRVLSAIVVPPHLSVSGGARAGEQLAAALAHSCDMHVADMMASGAELAGEGGGATRLPVRTWLPPGLPWSRLPNRAATLFYRSDIPGRVRAGGYDLVHLHNPMPALEMRRVARACRATGTPYVVSTHGFNEVANGEAIYGFGPLQRAAWRSLVYRPVAQTVRGAAAIFALSPADIPILAAMGWRGGEIHLVPNGVPRPAAADRAADDPVLERLGVPRREEDRRLTCLFLANHTPNKGLPVLLDACRRLAIPFRLIVGGETRAGIDYAAARTGLGPGQEILVTGRLADDEVGPLMRRADLFVFPTLADTLPLVVLEAMSHGLPVVASAVGGIPYQLAEGCGVLVPPGDASALASAIDGLADDVERRSRLSRAGLARVSAHFTWAEAARLALIGYERALAASRSEPRRARARRLGGLGPVGGEPSF